MKKFIVKKQCNPLVKIGIGEIVTVIGETKNTFKMIGERGEWFFIDKNKVLDYFELV